MSDSAIEPPTTVRKFLDSLKRQLTFHRTWQRLAMSGYVACTVGILICTTGATLAGGMNHSELAAYLAGLSTILVGIEKSMLFREKWKLHLAIATRLAVLSVQAESEQIPSDKAFEELSGIMNAYSESLPIAARDP